MVWIKVCFPLLHTYIFSDNKVNLCIHTLAWFHGLGSQCTYRWSVSWLQCFAVEMVIHLQYHCFCLLKYQMWDSPRTIMHGQIYLGMYYYGQICNLHPWISSTEKYHALVSLSAATALRFVCVCVCMCHFWGSTISMQSCSLHKDAYLGYDICSIDL